MGGGEGVRSGGASDAFPISLLGFYSRQEAVEEVVSVPCLRRVGGEVDGRAWLDDAGRGEVAG